MGNLGTIACNKEQKTEDKNHEKSLTKKLQGKVFNL